MNENVGALAGEAASRSMSQKRSRAEDAATARLTDEEQVTEQRRRLLEAQAQVEAAQRQLRELQKAAAPTSRTGYLRTLRESIGPEPQRVWERDEWDAMME